MENLIKSESEIKLQNDAINALNAKSSIPAKKKIIPQNSNKGEKLIAKKDAIKKINLSEFQKDLQGMQIKEKREKGNLYLYPKEWKGDKNIINGDLGKKWRNNKRNFLKSLFNNIFFYAKGDNIPEIQKCIAKFDAFYKEFYSLNDYSLASLSNSMDEGKIRDIRIGLEIIRKCKGMQEKDAKKGIKKGK